MDLKDLTKGEEITTTQNSEGVGVKDEICYVHVGSEIVGVGAFLNGDDKCIAAIITDQGSKKIISPEGDIADLDKQYIMRELEEAYEVFND